MLRIYGFGLNNPMFNSIFVSIEPVWHVVQELGLLSLVWGMIFKNADMVFNFFLNEMEINICEWIDFNIWGDVGLESLGF